MTAKGSSRQVLRLSDLSARAPTAFHLEPGAEERRQIARELDLQDLEALTFEGTIEAEGRKDWRLQARLTARATQTCVVSLEPVTSVIDETVTRRYLADMPPPAEMGEEIEMPEDDTAEPLPLEVDLPAVMVEALSLSLPDYPRRDAAELETAQFAAPGVTPLTDEDTKPFASLADLKDKLDKPN